MPICTQSTMQAKRGTPVVIEIINDCFDENFNIQLIPYTFQIHEDEGKVHTRTLAIEISFEEANKVKDKLLGSFSKCPKNTNTKI